MASGIANPSSHLGIRLREERNRLTLSQTTAAEIAGVSRAMWGRYEREENPVIPGGDVLLALMANGFDVTYILGAKRSAQDSGLTADETELVERFRECDVEGKTCLTRLARMEARRSRGD